MEPEWVGWVRRVAAIARNGLAYTEGPFDRQRYTELRGIAAEMAAALAGGAPERVRGLLEGEAGYATPKVDVRAAVFREGKILLVREREDGRWSLPGGWADAGHSPRACVEREVREEAGFRVRASKLLMVHDGRGHGSPPRLAAVYKLFFRCEIAGGEGAPDALETLEVGFFGEDEIPPLSSGRVTASQVARLFEHLRDPALPTDFD